MAEYDGPILNEDQDNLASISSSDYQGSIIKLLKRAIEQMDYKIKYAINMTDVDLASLKITRTHCAYLNNILVYVFQARNKLIDVLRPDLVEYIDELSIRLEDTADKTVKGAAPIDISQISFIAAAAEKVIMHYYSPPQPSFFQNLANRIVERLMLIVRGTKG